MLLINFIYLFTDSIIYLLLLIFPLYLWGTDKNELFFYIASLLLVGGMVYLLKIIFAVPRPPDAMIKLTSMAFPSTHAALGFFPLGFFFHKKKYRIILFVYGILIAYSRIYLRVHYWPDVIVGAIIGFLIPYIIYQRGIVKGKKE